MKGFKKVISALLVVVMVVTLITVTPNTKVSAATKIKPGKKLTLVVGKSAKFKSFKKGSKFKSSNKKVATVDKKGKIKAKGTGKCTITVTTGKKKKKSKITVIPANTTITSITQAEASTGLTVSWKKANKASGYYLYQSTNPTTGFVKVATVTGTSVQLKSLKEGTRYYYKVKAYGKSKTVSKSYSPVKSAVTKTMKLVWSDEFNGTKLDTATWYYEVGHGDNGWGNQEFQYYTDDGSNVKMENGNLVIIPRAEVKGGSTTYTSARIKTVDKEFKYGKMEIRAKATKAKGTWSAGWMLGSNISEIGWPKCGEIDIFESMNGSVPQTIHCPMWNNSKENKNYDTGLTQADVAKEYHTYGVIWTESTITFTVDGRVTGTLDADKYKISKYYNDIWVFNSPFFFILNCAIGGNAAGKVDLNNGWNLVKDENGTKVYEDYMYVDYVRVYQYR